MIRPLEGIRILESAHQYPGPYCSLLLADMGAEVIKIERPGVGDLATRGTGATEASANRKRRPEAQVASGKPKTVTPTMARSLSGIAAELEVAPGVALGGQRGVQSGRRCHREKARSGRGLGRSPAARWCARRRVRGRAELPAGQSRRRSCRLPARRCTDCRPASPGCAAGRRPRSERPPPAAGTSVDVGRSDHLVHGRGRAECQAAGWVKGDAAHAFQTLDVDQVAIIPCSVTQAHEGVRAPHEGSCVLGVSARKRLASGRLAGRTRSNSGSAGWALVMARSSSPNVQAARAAIGRATGRTERAACVEPRRTPQGQLAPLGSRGVMSS